MPSGPRPCVTGIMSGQAGGDGGMEGAGRGRWWVVAGPVKRRPPFKRSYFNSFSAPAWDFGVKVSTWLISFQWEDSAFRHRRSNRLGWCGKKKNEEVGSSKEPPSGPLMSDNPLLVGVLPLLTVRTLSHRPRTQRVTQEVWEQGRGVRRCCNTHPCMLTVEALSNSANNQINGWLRWETEKKNKTKMNNNDSVDGFFTASTK